MSRDLDARLPKMTDEDLYALDLSALDRESQDALLLEMERRRKRREADQTSRDLDINKWKARGRWTRWLLFAGLAAVLTLISYSAAGT